MRSKKLTLLAGMALAAVAFAIPAFASAGAWQHNGVPLGAQQHLTQSYEGPLVAIAGGAGQFSCVVTVTITAEGPNNGQVQEFSLATESCEGQGAFAGCVVVHHTTNLPWQINNAGNPAVVIKPGGKITAHFNLEEGSCASGLQTSHAEFAELKAEVTGKNPITALHIKAQATNGVATASTLTTTEEHPGTLGFSTGI